METFIISWLNFYWYELYRIKIKKIINKSHNKIKLKYNKDSIEMK